MIAFGCAISEPEPYHRYAEPGIRAAAEPDSDLFTFASVGPLARTYNLLLDAAAAIENLEALVLVDPQAELVEPDFGQKVRRMLSDPDVAVIGFAGARDVTSIAWWEGSVVAGPAIHRYGEHGGGEQRVFSWTATQPAPGEVETVDGRVLVLSPWAVRTIRFDERLGLNHGFDLDYCLQVRAAGRKVIAGDFRVILHRPIGLLDESELWIEAHIRVAEKWDGALSGAAGDEEAWKLRARRAEAEREAARALAYSHALSVDARMLELERALEEKTSTSSWRITAPLRRANQVRAVAEQRLRERRAIRAAAAGPRPAPGAAPGATRADRASIASADAPPGSS
jgi:hypothetical protein